MSDKERVKIEGNNQSKEISGVTEPRKEVIYSPVVISHITDNISDLFKSRLRDKNSIQIHYTSQMNSRPHLGTMMSLMTAFALGQHLSSDFNMPSILNFNVLENAPSESKVVDGLVYYDEL